MVSGGKSVRGLDDWISMMQVRTQPGYIRIIPVLLYISLVLQIPHEKVFRHPKPTPKPLGKGIGA